MSESDGKTRDLTEREAAFLLQLATNVKAAREAKGLTSEKVAWQAGIDKGYMSRVESAQRAPTLLVLLKLATALDVEPWELLRPKPAPSEGTQ